MEVVLSLGLQCISSHGRITDASKGSPVWRLFVLCMNYPFQKNLLVYKHNHHGDNLQIINNTMYNLQFALRWVGRIGHLAFSKVSVKSVGSSNDYNYDNGNTTNCQDCSNDCI